jgi:SAM-dependent methyltransferase
VSTLPSGIENGLMNEYAMMVYPAANRVYADASVSLLVNELRVFDETVLGARLRDIEQTGIGGVPYVTFRADGLSETDIGRLSNLSTLYALFEVTGGLLRPIEVRRLDVFDSDLLTIQRYAGKTNELFTKLLLNVTALATDRPGELTEGRLRVLDPLCGRGTTLNQAMMYGFDAAGVDTDTRDFDEYAKFIRTWLKNKRLKHTADITPIRRNKAHVGRRLDITLGATKERYQAGDTQRLSFVNADTVRADEFYKSGSFDLIVTDAPYGVQHGSRQDTHKLSRTPDALLAAALPHWVSLLRPGGALGISWNTYVLSRSELAQLLDRVGLVVRDSEPYRGFEHRVDQAIVRDLLVAHKPS